MTTRRGLILAGLLLAALLVVGRVLTGAYASWAWYHAMGADAVWGAMTSSLLALRMAAFIVAFSFSFANLLGMRRSIVSLVMPRRLGNLEIGEVVPAHSLTLAAALLSALIAGAFSLTLDDGLLLLRVRWAVPIGESDPYLQQDMASWIAWMPFERLWHEWTMALGVVVGATLLALYGLTPSVRLERGVVHVSTWVRRHFALYSAFLLLVMAWGYRLDAIDTLLHGSGVRETFTVFDHRVRLPYLAIVAAGTAAAALFVVWSGWVGRQRATLTALLLVLVAGPVGQVLLPVLDRRATPDAERARLNRPYETARALHTRRAFRVDDILRGAAADSLRVDSAVLAQSVSGWDAPALARALGGEPGIAVVTGAPTWLRSPSQMLRAAVLFGSTTGDAQRHRLAVQNADPTQADDRGAPWTVLDVGGTSLPALAVGQDLGEALVVDDTLGRLAAPRLGSGWRRVALAWGERRMRLLASEVAPARARLLLRRDVSRRVEALYPFFLFSTAPQAFIAEDSLWWSVEAFNAGEDYPLTEPIPFAGAVVRHASLAGLAIVNAHSGRVKFLLPDAPDAITRWWQRQLPAMFVTSERLSPALLAALPPLVETPRVQGLALARVGFRNDARAAQPLFQADDADPEVGSARRVPFVSGAPGRPLAWAVASVDATDRVRGSLVAVGGARPRTAFIEQPDTLSWSAVLNRMQRAADSTTARQAARHPRRGHAQAIPATDGLHVVQSFYEWPPEREPSLRVVVAYANGHSNAGRTLATAMGMAGEAPGTEGALRGQVARIHAALRDAMARGDWAAFGRAMDALAALVNAGR